MTPEPKCDDCDQFPNPTFTLYHLSSLHARIAELEALIREVYVGNYRTIQPFPSTGTERMYTVVNRNWYERAESALRGGK